MSLVCLHGVPTSPALWSRLGLPLIAPALSGTLAEQVAAVRPLVNSETVLVGHDMGGVVAAMVALDVRPQRLILTGTALGPYWRMVRATAWPGMWRFFYQRHGGRRFVAGAVSPENRADALTTFPGAEAREMRGVARSMCPPAGLAQKLRGMPVSLLWGSQDRWYPLAVARGIARASGADLQFVEGGHFVMWERPEGYAEHLRRWTG